MPQGSCSDNASTVGPSRTHSHFVPLGNASFSVGSTRALRRFGRDAQRAREQDRRGGITDHPPGVEAPGPSTSPRGRDGGEKTHPSVTLTSELVGIDVDTRGLGWNGSSWLLGGNSSAGVGPVALNGSHVTDLSRDVPAHNGTGWIHVISWNGEEWLYGGQVVFGILVGGRFVDLLPASPFSSAGVYAAGWNGWEWVSGGGAGQTVTVQEHRVHSVPQLVARFDQAVTLVVPLATGWMIGGKGVTTDEGMARS